jgi:YteA family regulatory protein
LMKTKVLSKNHIQRHQVHQLQKQLFAEKLDLEKRLKDNENYGLSDSLGDYELSSYDNHPADTATELYEREKDIALNENTEKHLNEINIALANIESGQYGNCTHCGQPIPVERLFALPATIYCIEHTPERVVSQRRPIEEQILAPPFGRTSLDELSEQNQFDGEDAWQIVESWGNSDSPAMAEDREIHDYNDMYIEADENDGFVESYESFLATDLYGKHVSVVRNKAYREYIANREGEPLLEPELDEEVNR